MMDELINSGLGVPRQVTVIFCRGVSSLLQSDLRYNYFVSILELLTHLQLANDLPKCQL
jgi:hypothetical protein